MSKPKLSQTVLLEILVSEIESFKKTQSAHQKLFDSTVQHLDKLDSLYNRPLSIDISPLELAHAQLQTTLKKGLYIPRWMWLIILILSFLLVSSFYVNYIQNKYIDLLQSDISALSSSSPSKRQKK